MGVAGSTRATVQNGVIHGLLCAVKHWLRNSTAKITYIFSHVSPWISGSPIIFLIFAIEL